MESNIQQRAIVAYKNLLNSKLIKSGLTDEAAAEFAEFLNQTRPVNDSERQHVLTLKTTYERIGYMFVETCIRTSNADIVLFMGSRAILDLFGLDKRRISIIYSESDGYTVNVLPGSSCRPAKREVRAQSQPQHPRVQKQPVSRTISQIASSKASTSKAWADLEGDENPE